MAAPDYVPTTQDERPRQPLGTPGHDGWTATRPGDLTNFQPSGRLFGNQGPDQGYGLVLAERFHGRLLVTEDDRREMERIRQQRPDGAGGGSRKPKRP